MTLLIKVTKLRHACSYSFTTSKRHSYQITNYLSNQQLFYHITNYKRHILRFNHSFGDFSLITLDTYNPASKHQARHLSQSQIAFQISPLLINLPRELYRQFLEYLSGYLFVRHPFAVHIRFFRLRSQNFYLTITLLVKVGLPQVLHKVINHNNIPFFHY